jgi:hypothetical protein
MNNRLLGFILLIAFFFVNNQVSGEKNEYDSAWGIGILLSQDQEPKSETIDFPDCPINAYESPNGRIIGSMLKS